MSYKEKEIEKIYYTIGEVAVMFNVTTSLIRFWEKEFDIIIPKKNKKGNRRYTKDIIENIKLVYYLVKKKSHTLKGAKEIINNRKNKILKHFEIIKSLENVKAFLVELQEKL